jgi:hypothetical protein
MTLMIAGSANARKMGRLAGLFEIGDAMELYKNI